MSKYELKPSESYGKEQAAKWMYDDKGYCPFAQHKLEFLLALAFEAGAASIKKTSAFTPLQRKAIVDVLRKSIASGPTNLGLEHELNAVDAREMMRVLERVLAKLNTKEEVPGEGK